MNPFKWYQTLSEMFVGPIPRLPPPIRAKCAQCREYVHEDVAWWCTKCNATIIKTDSKLFDEQKQLKRRVKQLETENAELKAEIVRLKWDLLR